MDNGNNVIGVDSYNNAYDPSFKRLRQKVLNSKNNFKEFELNCGSFIDILIYKDQYIGNSSLRMNASVCYNLALLKVLNTSILLIFITISLYFGLKYFKNKSNREDLTDLIQILKNRNNQTL